VFLALLVDYVANSEGCVYAAVFDWAIDQPCFLVNEKKIFSNEPCRFLVIGLAIQEMGAVNRT